MKRLWFLKDYICGGLVYFPLFSWCFPALCVLFLCVEFWTLAADAQWNDSDIKAVFSKGLNERLKEELATQDEPANLHSLISLPGKI